MDVAQGIRAFALVVDEGSFAAAARRLGVTRSAVQKNVVQLESHLGVQLLTRSTRRLRPTETGLRFYERGAGILEEIDAAIAEVSDAHQRVQGVLRINAPMSFGYRYVGPIAAAFMAEQPQIRVDLILNDRFVDTIEEGFDLTIRVSEPDATTSLICERLVPTDRILCASPRFLSAAGPVGSPAALRDLRCLHYGHNADMNSWTLLGPQGKIRCRVNCVMWSNSGEVLMTAAMGGQGIVLLPTFLVADELARGTLVRVLPEYHLPGLFVQALYPRHRHHNPKVQAFVEFLRGSLAHRPPSWV